MSGEIWFQDIIQQCSSNNPLKIRQLWHGVSGLERCSGRAQISRIILWKFCVLMCNIKVFPTITRGRVSFWKSAYSLATFDVMEQKTWFFRSCHFLLFSVFPIPTCMGPSQALLEKTLCQRRNMSRSPAAYTHRLYCTQKCVVRNAV